MSGCVVVACAAQHACVVAYDVVCTHTVAIRGKPVDVNADASFADSSQSVLCRISTVLKPSSVAIEELELLLLRT